MAKAATATDEGQAPAKPAADATDTGTPTADAQDGKTPAAGADDGAAPAKPAVDRKKKPADATDTKTPESDTAGKGGKVAPETYALSVPEGAEAYLDANDLKQIEVTARAKGWTNEEAQGAIEEHADALAAQSAAFRSQTEKDTTYGGEHLQETQRLVGVALDKFAPDDEPLGKALRRDLARSGYGNKLSVVSMLARIGKAMSEDQPGLTASKGAGPKKLSATEILYGPEKTD